MPAWKVLLVGFFGFATVAIAVCMVIIPFAYDGNERWMWLGGLFVGFIVNIVLFVLFLKSASRALDAKPGSGGTRF